MKHSKSEGYSRLIGGEGAPKPSLRARARTAANHRPQFEPLQERRSVLGLAGF